jgi:hypothetical protein
MGAVRLPGYETICNPTKYNAKLGNHVIDRGRLYW